MTNPTYNRWFRSESSSDADRRREMVTIHDAGHQDVHVSRERADVFLSRENGHHELDQCEQEDSDGSRSDGEPVAEARPARPARNAKRGSSDGG